MRCETYPLHTLGTYQFVVIISVYRGKLMLSRHKNRSTWETQGGHIEGGESLIEAAGRELYEESGAVKYLLSPAFDYRAGDENLWGNGVVFIAEIDEIGALPESEMEEVAFSINCRRTLPTRRSRRFAAKGKGGRAAVIGQYDRRKW